MAVRHTDCSPSLLSPILTCLHDSKGSLTTVQGLELVLVTWVLGSSFSLHAE